MDFLSKADTLLTLSPLIQSAEILHCEKVYYGAWQQKAEQAVKGLCQQFEGVSMVVRSSSNAEDTEHSSNAGAFYSALNVKSESQLVTAINDVFSSYPTVSYDDCHLLVQRQLTDVMLSGVAFSVDMKTGSPYIVVNFDDETGSTESITSGEGAVSHVEYWLKSNTTELSGWKAKLAALIDELAQHFPDTPLDIEFAFDRRESLYLFQVRPLVLKESQLNPSEIVGHQISEQIRQTKQKVARLCQLQPGLVGGFTIFANMPDWNPAEIIGVKPKPLALSLYKELVTDGVWAYQRHKYGYRNLRSFPLLVSLAHSPYIDTRVSFNSFVPKAVDDTLAEKLVNYYLEKLRANPSLHDKVEFDIVLSCYSLDIDTKLSSLPKTFSIDEKVSLKDALFTITDKIINGEPSLLTKDIAKIKVLEQKQVALPDTSLNDVEKIYWLIEDCKRYGTLPFAGIARAAFVATQILESLVSCHLLSSERKDQFLHSLTTVSSDFVSDRTCMSQESFLGKYGHLRPGTYDIESLRYDEMPKEALFADEQVIDKEPVAAQSRFTLSNTEHETISVALANHGFSIDAQALLDFFKTAIEAREWSKFVFSKSVSEVIKLIQGLGKRFDLSNQLLAFADIKEVMSLYASTLPAKHVMLTSIERNKSFYELCALIPLPPVILPDTNLAVFRLPDCLPNFVTKRKVVGEVAEQDHQELSGKVVFIESADPGYDWIFSKNIAGLVTMYGGANSHMAIRANELGIPAVIGAGEAFYQQWQEYNVVSMDCAAQKVTKIR